MKNLFSFVLDFANAIVWAIVLGIRLYQGGGWGIVTILCTVFALINLIAGLVNFSRFRKARAKKQAEKSEKEAAAK